MHLFDFISDQDKDGPGFRILTGILPQTVDQEMYSDFHFKPPVWVLKRTAAILEIDSINDWDKKMYIVMLEHRHEDNGEKEVRVCEGLQGSDEPVFHEDYLLRSGDGKWYEVYAYDESEK